ncbi:MAG: beta-N-acetylglucosaminidase domain-containing protein [Acidimicrobiales bacterium]|nr:beta-N-acetylglucosaminidase domain-containing protein [Acidimicrobiales bacterium]
MPWAMRGVIEGFYGRPWTWDERIEVARSCADGAMTHYVYAPKDDPYHRDRWREPYPPDALAGFERLIAEGGLSVGFAISPGLSIDPTAQEDREALAAKVAPMLDLGVELVVLALDDLPPRPGLGEEHAALAAWLHEWLGGRAELALVPTEYTGTGGATPYLDALAGLPGDVAVGWTGPFVVNDAITVDDARRRREALGGRPPLLWDNWPVNDAVMADRLFLGPLRGRDPGLAEVCSGYLANPMVQPRANALPLATVAAFLRGDDPTAAWAAAAEAGGLRVFAEACDGGVPGALVAEVVGGGPTRALASWLDTAAHCEAPGLEHEAAVWIEQVHAEARLGRSAVRLLEAVAEGRLPAAHEQALAIAFAWPAVRRGSVSVMGPRCGFRPVLGQDDAGRWVLRPEALDDDANAIDRLVRFALSRLAGA